MDTSRAFRNRFPTESSCDPERPGNWARLPVGTYCAGKIEVRNDGSVLISPDAYVDDVVALAAGAIRLHPGISYDAKSHLHAFIQAMDTRALEIHGYSESAAERNYQWRPFPSQS